MEKKSIQGKGESKRWKREATLRDILDALNEIRDSDKSVEEKAELRKRVVDFGQFLAEEIHHGRREVPQSDDNKTIKEFNLRMLQSYYMDRKGVCEEAKSPEGYHNQKNEFVKNNGEFANHGQRNGRNPRWYPIALKDEENAVIVPVKPNVSEGNGGGGMENVPLWQKIEDELFIKNPADVGKTVPLWQKIEDELFVKDPKDLREAKPFSEGGVSDKVGETLDKSDESKKKRGSVLPWLMPLIPLVMMNECGHKEDIAPFVDKNDGDNKEVVAIPLSANETSYLRYTVEKGTRMLAHQTGMENAEKVYLSFVENADKMPSGLKDLVNKYNMHKMVDEGVNVNLSQRNEIVATTLLLMSETYPNIKDIILEQMQNPQKEIADNDLRKIESRLMLAKNAHTKCGGDENSNLVSDVDYGVFGADKKTGWCVDFSKEYKKLESGKQASDKEFYQEVVRNTFNKGGNDRY